MPDNEKITMWNGGETNKYDRMIRESEDYYDEVDSETTFRDDLRKRERLMKEQDERNPIKSKFGTYNERINKDMDKPASISGGDPKNRYRRPEGNNE